MNVLKIEGENEENSKLNIRFDYLFFSSSSRKFHVLCHKSSLFYNKIAKLPCRTTQRNHRILLLLICNNLFMVPRKCFISVLIYLRANKASV